ncbi:MAG TPA: glycosyltransferase family 4 protein, partial [Bacteroidetes bacterium]|nr:glycosyltransferase family 4 protein [Bacteroidota bacterium]
MKKVLIITYYWPPSGGSGVQRWLKMSKYLPEAGWQPVVYTAENAEYPVEDPSLEKDISPDAIVIKRPIVEPYSAYKKFLGIKKDKKIKAGFLSTEEKSSFKENIARWIRGNLFIPDARCWWVRPSVKYLLSYLANNPVDAVISTGPPHSMHLIGLKLHEKTGLPWIADFRDPWTEIDFYDELRLTRWADRKQREMEREVLTKATKVVTVSRNWAEGLEQLGAENVVVIENGFDFSPEKLKDTVPLTQKFTISHVGIIGPSRNAPNLWKVLGQMVRETDGFKNDLEIRLIGQVDFSVTKSLQEHGLSQNSVIMPYIPHEEVMNKQFESQILLLLINNTKNSKGILTGKFYEYLYAGR